MASLNAFRKRVPLPTSWELWELAIHASLLPLIVLPRAVGMVWCRLFARFLIRRGSSYRSYLERDLPAGMLQAAGGDPTDLLRASETAMLYERVLALRGILLPFWPRSLRLVGGEHVRAGLEAGHGVILWVQPCIGSTVCVKAALFNAGIPLAHLTRPSHGFSAHPFGVRFANRFFRRAENRFLAERVVIHEGHTVAPLRRLRVLLGENRVVSITVTDTASRLGEFPMLGGRLVLPDGPVELAAKTGAVLLPVFTAGSRPTAIVQIGAPLPVAGATPEAIRARQAAALEWLQQRIEQHPRDWIGWRAHLYLPATPEPARV